MTSLMEIKVTMKNLMKIRSQDDQGDLWQTKGLTPLQITSFHTPSALIATQCWKQNIGCLLMEVYN